MKIKDTFSNRLLGFSLRLLDFLLIPFLLSGLLFLLDKNGFFEVKQIDLQINNQIKVSLSSELPLAELPLTEIPLATSSTNSSAPLSEWQDLDSSQVSYYQSYLNDLNTTLKSFKHKSLWKLKLEDIEKKIYSSQWVQSIQISRLWPSTLLIQIAPKGIAMIYLSKKGGLWPIQNDGTFLPRMKSGSYLDLPILQGESFAKKIEARKNAILLLNELPREGPFAQHNISEIHFNETDGYSVILNQNGLRIKLGENRIKLKAQRISQVLNYIHAHDFDADLIDANLSKKVLVKRK